MKQLLSILGSMKTMAVFMLIFAAAIGYATFLENDYGTMTAKAEIYNARWFEVLMAVLTINLIINIFRFKMFSAKKAPIFIFHLAFIIIVLGAAITRYVGYEGTMRIREGATANSMISADTYFKVSAKAADKEISSEEKLYLSKKSNNNLSSILEIDGKKVEVKLAKYIPDAIEQLVEQDSGGFEVLDMMVAEDGQTKAIQLRKGEFYENGGIAIDFGSNRMFLSPTLSVFSEDGNLYIKHEMPLNYLKMDTKEEGSIEPSQKTPFEARKLHAANGNNFVLRAYYKHATTKLVSNPKASPMQPESDALVFDVKVGQNSQQLTVIGQAGRVAKEYHIDIEGVDVHIAYGAKMIKLPFSIKLNDFIIDRYPGSMSPASYASEVELIDSEKNINMPYRIYMNHILEHRGYRFFQSSYDSDEKGTVLSVNNDPGTIPSYIGYILLGIGMFWSLFSRKNRFAQLSKIAQDTAAKKGIAALFMVGLILSFSQSLRADDTEIKAVISYDKEHAKAFGKLVVQDSAGRMKPLDTLNKEILTKIYKSSTLQIADKTLDANQVILGMMSRPETYRNIKMIRTKNEEVNKLIGVKSDTVFVSFSQFFVDSDNLQGYKIAEAVDNAIRKEPKQRDMFDKAVLEIDERVNVSYAVYSGALIKIWPKAGDENNKWYPTVEALQTFSENEALAIRDIAYEYFSSLDSAIGSGNWNSANTAVEKIASYQNKFGSAVIPSDSKLKAEMLYNNLNIFERSYPIYLLIGFVLLIASFTKILKSNLNITLVTKVSLMLLGILFVAHTFGLGLRWYVSGHAPWSDGYESMIYISWATILAGFIFTRKSVITLASTAILTGLILFVAHLNWMNPQVTNLVPVLNSYWLSLHVAIITASYGFLGLGALLGFIVVLLFALINDKNKPQLTLAIKELNAINEMGLMAGLAFLTLGNFIGGVWANESWGRYWGWDPKETWALVTILVYAVVVHLRFIKALYSEFNFAVIALLSYTSVLMTYFGVNYYLAGMHSYAKGDSVPVPDFVPVTYTILFILIAVAFRNKKAV